LVGIIFFKRIFARENIFKNCPFKLTTSQFKKMIPGGRQHLTIQDAGNQKAI
jgi:hypothetical protein